MRIAIYVRVSTQRQAQTQTIEQQIDRLRTHLQSQGRPLPEGDIFRDDGYSGASLKRPGLDRLRDRQTLLVYARYDLTFPVDLSKDLVQEFDELRIPHEVAVLPCGHYSTGKTPFKYLDGWILTRFLKRALVDRV